MAVKQADSRRRETAQRAGDLEVARADGIAILTLARPDLRNSPVGGDARGSASGNR